MARFQLNRPAILVIGLALGCVIGLNVGGLIPSVPLHATATQGLGNFAIATGLVDESVEGLYFLDFITGDLRCAVINPRTGMFNSLFTYNVASDFAARGGPGKAKYLMVTGLANIPRGRVQFARSIVYVAEATTGEVAAYAIPWNSSLQAAGKAQAGVFKPLDKRKIRTMTLRD